MQAKYCPLCRCDLQLRTIDGVSRLTCSSSTCQFVHWNNPIPVVAGLVQWEGRYVLARNASWPTDMFSLLTGFLEQDESPESAIIREVREELGLRAERAEFVGHFPLPIFNQLIIAYVLEGQGTLRLNQEIAEVKVISRGELADFDFGPLELTRQVVGRWLAAESCRL